MTDHRTQLFSLLGDLPPRNYPVTSQIVSSFQRDGVFGERLILDCNGIEPVPALYLRPAGRSGPFPAVLYNHAHGGDYVTGKESVLNRSPSLESPSYAVALTQLGFAVLCIDHWGFGERRGRRESEIFKEMLWRGQVMWGMMVFDSIRAIDFLSERPEIDPNRIGTIGTSMGSTMAWWLAALDPRIAACVDICCLTEFESLIKNRGIDGHGIYYYVPSLLKHTTTARINALIAPRPHLSLAGIYDPLTPLEGLERIDAELTQVYKSAGAPDAWRLSKHHCGHVETVAMQREALDFLARWL